MKPLKTLKTPSLHLFGFLIALFTAPQLDAQISVIPLRGQVMIDRGGERPERIREIAPFEVGERLLTGSASAAILLLPSGARLSLQSDATLVFSAEGSPAETSGTTIPLFILREGFAAVRVPREAISEGLHVETDAGTVVAEIGAGAINVLSDRANQRVVMLGVENGRMRLLPPWDDGRELLITQGDAYTLTQLPLSAEDPPAQAQEQILVGELRSRLLSALEDIDNAQTVFVGTRQRNRPTQAVTSLPRADHLPRPHPATGRLPPEELMR